MNALDEFAEQRPDQQIAIIDEIEQQNKFEVIPALFELLNTPYDDIVVHMIRHALTDLLSKNEAETLKGLASDDLAVKRFCLGIVRQKQIESALPILTSLVDSEKDSAIVLELITALSSYETAISLDVFKRFMYHTDTFVAAQSIEILGNYKDHSSVKDLIALVDEGEADDQYERCELPTYNAVEALGKFGDDTVLSYLASKIHHRNPTIRQLIQKQLVQTGSKTVPLLAAHFFKDDTDNKIMAATVLGLIGSKKGADILISALNDKTAEDPNVKLAIYEALGKLPPIEHIDNLLKGLAEENEPTLMAVISALDRQANTIVMNTLQELINNNNEQSERLLKAIVFSKALNLFEYLFEEEKIADKLVEEIYQSDSLEIVLPFQERLEQMGARAESALRQFKRIKVDKIDKKILIVEDSRPIVQFYKRILSTLGTCIEAVENGQQAIDILERDENFNLIIVDMNMPVMNGIELTKKIRAHSKLQDIPIIMVTSESKSSQVSLAEKAGVNRFFQKPLTAGKLKNIVKELILTGED